MLMFCAIITPYLINFLLLMNPEIFKNNEQRLPNVLGINDLVKSHEVKIPKERKTMIFDLISKITETEYDDIEGKKYLCGLTKHLLETDPLTDQQAGTLARFIKYSDYLPYNPDFSLDDIFGLYTGNWDTVTKICTATIKGKENWERSLGEQLPEDKKITVYRGMRLTNSQVKKIKNEGIIPAGVWRNGSVDEALWEQFSGYLNHKKNLTAKDSIGLMLTNIPFSKCNVLRDHWQVPIDSWEGFDSPDSLAISTTPKTNIKTAKRFGNYILKMEISSDRLVPRYFEDGMVDYSVLFNIEPSAIKKIIPSWLI